MVNFNQIKIGQYYNRKGLTSLWGLKGHQGLSRGVYTPANKNLIVLFVTKEKQGSATQYIDYISEDFLYWEGEEKGGNDNRIIMAKENGDEIHLFYRPRHHQDFIYKGLLELADFLPQENKPSKFIFELLGVSKTVEVTKPTILLGNRPIVETERASLRLSRIGQGAFRIKLMDLWKNCAISNINFPEILRASHIRPWRDSSHEDRLNPYNGLLLTPTYDLLFDKGYISFKHDGLILLSKEVSAQKELLQITPDLKLRTVYPNNLPFLEYHRDVLFKK